MLVVEDHAFQRQYLVSLLRKQNVPCIRQAAGGEEALRHLAEEVPDIVFLDLQMPGMDGVEFIAQLSDRGFPGSLILASGLEPGLVNTVERVSEARGISVLGKLEKPVEPDQIAVLLGRHERHRPRQPAVRESTQRPSVGELKAALESRQFVPYYQPKVRFSDQALDGVEALARWNHPARGLVSPGEFIPLLEEAGILDQLTEIMAGGAIRQCRDWLDQGREIKVSVNLSPTGLSDRGVFGRLVGLVEEHRISAEMVTLEVTESAIAADPVQAAANLVRFRMQGFGLSIDDFGTGYSSLQQLNQIPFTELKIDRSFVHGVCGDPRLQAIVESSLELARKLDLVTTAEGVESKDDWDYLQGQGCDFCQGFYSGRPMPGPDLADWDHAR